MLVRRMTPADIPAGLRLCRACHWNQLAEDWRVFLELPGGSCRLALNATGPGETVVGTVASLRYGPHFTWLAMMLVDPQLRRSGIGSQLLEAELDSLAAEASVRLDATPAGEPLYRRYRFTAEYELVRLKATVAADRFQPEPGAARPIQAEDLPAIFAMDREVFGEDRSALLRTFHQRAPQLAWVAAGGAGYTFGRPGHLYTQLGPIVAREAPAARQLVAHCLARQAGATFNIDAISAAPPWIDWLQSAGFVVERPFLRMRRGALAYTERRDLQFGIAGPEFG